MESSVAIALNQLKQMTKKIEDNNERKIQAARRSIECGRVRPVSKELKVAPSTIRRYRKKLLQEYGSSDSTISYSTTPESIIIVEEPKKETKKPVLKFTIEVRPNGKKLVCCKCKNSIDIKDLSSSNAPAPDSQL